MPADCSRRVGAESEEISRRSLSPTPQHGFDSKLLAKIKALQGAVRQAHGIRVRVEPVKKKLTFIGEDYAMATLLRTWCERSRISRDL